MNNNVRKQSIPIVSVRLKLTQDELKSLDQTKIDELCVRLPWLKSYLQDTSAEAISTVPTKQDIVLAKIGINALIDEATGYQEVREPDELVSMAEVLSKPDVVVVSEADIIATAASAVYPVSVEQYQSVKDEPKVTVVPSAPLTKKVKRKYNFKKKEDVK